MYPNFWNSLIVLYSATAVNIIVKYEAVHLLILLPMIFGKCFVLHNLNNFLGSMYRFFRFCLASELVSPFPFSVL